MQTGGDKATDPRDTIERNDLATAQSNHDCAVIGPVVRDARDGMVKFGQRLHASNISKLGNQVIHWAFGHRVSEIQVASGTIQFERLL